MEESTPQPDALEALLFIYGAPMSFRKAGHLLSLPVPEVRELAERLLEQLKTRGSGLSLLLHSETMQLVTRSDLHHIVETVVTADLKGSLSPASLETLTIVAYAGPISRPEVDYIRGVNSSFTLRSLLLRGLIRRLKDSQNTYRYEVSSELLKHLGLSEVSDLPEYDQFKELIEKMRTANHETEEDDA